MKIRYTVALSMFAGAAIGALAIQGLHAQAKPPVYFIVENDISDVQSYIKEYAVHARDMIKARGGRYIAAGDATTLRANRLNLGWPYSSSMTTNKLRRSSTPPST
jgi:hypothetical protein